MKVRMTSTAVFFCTGNGETVGVYGGVGRVGVDAGVGVVVVVVVAVAVVVVVVGGGGGGGGSGGGGRRRRCCSRRHTNSNSFSTAISIVVAVV